MVRTDYHREQVQQLVRKSPYEAFALLMESGDRIILEHPENIAFDPRPNGRDDFYVISEKIRYWSGFSAVTSIAVLDRGELAA